MALSHRSSFAMDYAWPNPSLVARVKRHIHWQIKMASKILLACLPLDYRFWARLLVTKHGDMDLPTYAFSAFCHHFERAHFARKAEGGFVTLELGPGDSLFSALIAKALGGSETYLVDVGPFARRDFTIYHDMTTFLREKGLCTAPLETCKSLEEMLEVCSAHYSTEGLKSLREIPTQSADLVWSHAVLQSIQRREFLATLRELRRIQRPDGVGSHLIELKDCLSGALNNLRFRERIWESAIVAKSGFYTNRIRCTEMLGLFREAGFSAEVLETQRWEALPTPRQKLAMPFRDFPNEELCISALDVLLH
jgi:hypothetical protein